MAPPNADAAAPVRARTRPVFHPLRVAAIESLCDDAAAVTFEIPPELAGQFAFSAGQSLTLRQEVDGRDERRSYSICAPVGAAPRIGVRVVPGGLFSSWLVHELRAGDTVQVMPPTGAFTPDLTRPGHHVLIAAGSGITPMLSIAASVLADPDSRVTLFYGNRRTGTVMFTDQLADLKDQYQGRFQLSHVLSREPREAALLSGRLDAERLEALIGALVDIKDTDHWWLCGPDTMVTGAQELLHTLGVPAERVHQELFYANDTAPVPARQEEPAYDGPTSSVTVILDGRETTADLARGVTVLDGAQRLRPDLPFACKGGVCGTCRALVVEGEVEMRRNFALERAEVDAGYVLTCQAVPVSGNVVIDFDS
ncbi:1,2-phenylacetyl-CoA epoxidase subunit PaaE [Streptomyces sp. NPDC056773]|uniref:1,2-phenylacetyl-CoA epoxidase subunit PaaE n=1 Tax=unclassified Streptomyces TaxID=2593676 RepID=UPI00367CE744